MRLKRCESQLPASQVNDSDKRRLTEIRGGFNDTSQHAVMTNAHFRHILSKMCSSLLSPDEINKIVFNRIEIGTSFVNKYDTRLNEGLRNIGEQPNAFSFP
jgi:hypothetical protein